MRTPEAVAARGLVCRSSRRFSARLRGNAASPIARVLVAILLQLSGTALAQAAGAPAAQAARLSRDSHASPPEPAAAPTPASAATGVVELGSLRIPKVLRPPQLKDFLEDTPREAEAIVSDFRQRQPGDGVPVSERTTAFLSYDDHNLYVVFVCGDRAGDVRGHMAKREEIGDDDAVGIYLDTFRDHRHAYSFEANPLGLQRDGLVNEGQKTDYTFDTVWRSDGRLTEHGYVVWMSIPFKSLRFADARVQTWGIALQRRILRTNEDVFWPYVTDRISGFVNQMGVLEGMSEISSGHNAQFTPYGTFTGSRFLDRGIPDFRTQDESHGGIDSKFVIKDAFTVDLTAGPDFSQVESDEPQVTVNQRYEVKFPEKRPFFMDNAGYFQTPFNLFYSRRIVDPQFGARVTGKAGPWAVGALAEDDRAEGKLLDDSDPLYRHRAGIGIVRIQRELGSQSSAGVLVTSRDFGPTSNRVVAADTRLRLSRNWYFTGQVMHSDSRQRDGEHGSGSAYLTELDYGGRHFSFSHNYTDFGPSFGSDLGFVQRVDLRTVSEYAGYMWYPKGKHLLSFGPTVSVSRDWDHQGRLQDWNVYPTFAANFARQTGVKVTHSESYEAFTGLGFRESVDYVSAYTSLARWLALAASYGRGTTINYSPPGGIAPFLADQTNASLSLTWRPAERLRVESLYLHTGLASPTGRPLAGVPASARVFDNDLIRWKLNYQFTPALSVRTILDYYGLVPNASLITYTQSKMFTGDVLLTYLIHPGTALYIGSTNRLENLAIDPTLPPRLSLTGSPSTLTTRQLFVKLSYLFRM